jgi:hypothetical protein
MRCSLVHDGDGVEKKERKMRGEGIDVWLRGLGFWAQIWMRDELTDRLGLWPQ